MCSNELEATLRAPLMEDSVTEAPKYVPVNIHVDTVSENKHSLSL